MAELGEFAKHHNEFKALNVQIIGVSVDPLSKARMTESELKLPFPLLSDSHRTVTRLYGTRSPSRYNSPDGLAYDTATLLLIDKTGTIRWIYQNSNYKIRSPISQDLAEAKKLGP
jgi:peroxiredoxin